MDMSVGLRDLIAIVAYLMAGVSGFYYLKGRNDVLILRLDLLEKFLGERLLGLDGRMGGLEKSVRNGITSKLAVMSAVVEGIKEQCPICKGLSSSSDFVRAQHDIHSSPPHGLLRSDVLSRVHRESDPDTHD